MRGVTPGALLFISLGMGVLGIIIGRVIFLPAKPVTPVPKGWEVQGWNACEMDLVTCQMELAGAQEEIAVRQQQSPAVSRIVVCEPSLPNGCTETCQLCFHAMADITKILEGP